MATNAKPAAASSKTPPELEEKKSVASDTELKQRGLDDALFTLLKQLSRTALHSTTSLQAVIHVLDKEEYRTIEDVKLITMDHLKEWFPGARKTQDVLLKLFSASGPTPAQLSGGWSSLAIEETTLFAPGQLKEFGIEGVDVSHYLSLDRVPLCAYFAHLFTQYGAVIFRSPPHSGKTSIASLLADYLARCTAIQTYYACATIVNYDVPSPNAKEPVLSAWNHRLRAFELVSGALADVMASSNQLDRLLVLDEAQMWYKREKTALPYVADTFWSLLKLVHTSGPLRVLVLSTYMSSSLSSATPFTFVTKAQVALPDALLSSEEMSELFRRWSTAYDLRLTPLVQQYLRRLTRGHIGYLTGLLSGLRDLRRSSNDSDPEARYLSNLAYPREVLRHCRIPPSSDLLPNHKNLLRVLLFKWAGLSSNDVLAAARLTSDDFEVAKTSLCHFGYLVETKDGKLQLTALILHFYLAGSLITSTTEESLTTPDALLSRVLKRFDPNRLTASLSRAATGAPNEYTWQGEFYVALCQCLPAGISASISFGHGYGTEGSVDFYINSKYKWAFELTREGDRLAEHVDRFVKPDGIYYKLTQEVNGQPPVIKEWRVVDIRQKKVKKKTMLDGVVYACYNRTFTEYTLKRKGKSDDPVRVERAMPMDRTASVQHQLEAPSPTKSQSAGEPRAP